VRLVLQADRLYGKNVCPQSIRMTSQISRIRSTVRRFMRLRPDSPMLSQNTVLDHISELSNVLNSSGKHTDEYKAALATLGYYKRKYRNNSVVVERINQVMRLKSLPGTWKVMSSTKRAHSSSRKGGAKRKTRRQ
jgi:hypothetical protein